MLARLLAVAGGAIICTDLDGRIAYCSDPARQLLGISGDERGRDSVFDWLPRSESVRLFALYQAMLDGQPRSMAWQAEGSSTWRSVQVQVLDSDPETNVPRLLVNTFGDQTERRLADEAMRRDALVLAQLQDAVVCTDPGLRVVYWNEAAERIFDWRRSEVLGRSVLERLPREVHEQVALVMQGIQGNGRETEAEWEDFRKDGSRVWIHWRSRALLDENGRFLGVVSIGVDVTARRAEERRRVELESQLFHAQRVETIGLFSSGIAHDFNNVLAAILMRAEVALGDQALSAKARANLEDIRRAGRRALAMARRILRFGRHDEQDRVFVDLRALLDEVACFVRPGLSPLVEIKLELPVASPLTLADENRLYQVFVNLASNAAGAMPTGGVMTLSLRETWLSEAKAMTTGTVAPGRYAVVSVVDTGLGMEPEIMRRMFEPFFTTKPSGEGTGLGLAIVATIVGQHGGAIQVSSSPGSGSEVSVFLPTLDGDSRHGGD